MRTGIWLFFAAVFAASLALPQTPPASAKKSTTANAAKKRTASTTARKGKSAKKKPVVAAYRQQSPTPDRYREIQQALIDRGYLKSEPNGVWDAQSSEALKQFQTDQKLSPTGKLSAASLIGLGLGPKTASSQPGIDPPALPGTAPAVLPATAN